MASKRGLHVLIVDCDKYMVEATVAMLELLGCTARGETQSLMALRVFSDNPDKFDLAILEPVMPELMGVDLAVRLKRIRRDFPVMLYSGYIGLSLAETIEAAGLGQAIFKPLGLQEMKESIQETMRPSSIGAQARLTSPPG
ncbi:MAG TPA: response regulator [Syntrophorhabdaceae bacterium]|jgi:DNA-binding NtrC family response regulator